jgi:hypothetical protein
MPRRTRKQKLIKPRLQLWVTGVFLMTTCAAVLAQFVMLNRVLVVLAREMPEQSEVLMEQWPTMLRTTLGLTIALLVPFTLGVGILTTFRIAGPLYRFEEYMGQVARGEDRGPCQIRKGDMLQEVCDKLNLMVTALRAQQDHGETRDVDSVPSLVERNADARAEQAASPGRVSED